MRIVLDTNVLVSGLLTPDGNPGRIVDLFLAGEVVLLSDDRIMAEYRSVLRRPRFGFAPADLSDFLALVESRSERVTAPPLGFTLPDEQDRAFLEVAVGGSADSLVTGNTRHFPKTPAARLIVESPTEFVRRWRDTRG